MSRYTQANWEFDDSITVGDAPTANIPYLIDNQSKLKNLNYELKSNIRISNDPNSRPLFRAMANRNISNLEHEIEALRQDYYESVRNRQIFFKKYRKYKGLRGRAHGLKPTYNPWTDMGNIFWRNDLPIEELDRRVWDN